jgi:hypothetical protein
MRHQYQFPTVTEIPRRIADARGGSQPPHSGGAAGAARPVERAATEWSLLRDAGQAPRASLRT